MQGASQLDGATGSSGEYAMKNSTKRLIMISLVSSMLLSGCALSTEGLSKPDASGSTVPPQTSAASGTRPVTTPAGTTSPVTAAPSTTLPDTTAPDTTAPATTEPVTQPDPPAPDTTTPSTIAPETTGGTTTATTTTASTTTAKPADPADVKSGDAYDTATVRNWMRLASKAAHYPEQKLVFLTFDDGPSSKVTPKILDVLKKNQVHATFFYYTHGDLSSRAAVVRRTAAEGHAIAIHTNSHKYNILYPNRKANVEAIVKDAEKATGYIQAILGDDWKPSVYRFPGGSFSWTATASSKTAMANAKSALSDMGLEYIDWNALSGDSDNNNKDKSPSGLLKYTIKTTKNAYGHVIVLLMHDANHVPNTPKALQGIIDYYKKNGYEFGILK